MDGTRSPADPWWTGRWSASVLLSEGPGEHFRPVVCADSEGAWVAYETLLHGTYALYMRRWTPTGLTPPVRFSLTDAWEMHPSLCADSAGGVWAAWIATHDVQRQARCGRPQGRDHGISLER